MVSPNFNHRYSSASQALNAVRNLKLGSKLLDIKTIIGAGTLLLILAGTGLYYWRLESSVTKTSEVEMFEQDQTQFPFLYRNDATGVSIKYPSSWKLAQSGQNQGTIAKLTPEKEQSFLITPEVRIEVEQSPTDSLERYTTNEVYQITQLPQAKIIDSLPVSFAGGDGHKIIYTMVNPDNQLEQKYLQFWTLKSDRIYKVTYQTTTTDYVHFASTVEQEMIPSIKINPK